MALAIPMKLDAFVFNKAVCNGKKDDARIAPINQPNYTFLRMENYMALSDLLPHTDLENASPASRNSRYTDLGTREPRTSRCGVYVHWSLPRAFRGGEAKATTDQTSRTQPAQSDKPQKDSPKENDDNSAPSFPLVPNRWLVIRSLDPEAKTTLPQGASIPAVTAWVIESDCMRRIDDLGLDVDLQVDVSPFINSVATKHPDQILMSEQAEVFIGRCTPVREWQKRQQEEPADRIDLTVASSSNQLFPDFQYHCGNVFSMLDTFAYTEKGEKKHLTAAHADYYVVGWQTEKDQDILAKKGTDPENRTRRDRLEAHGLQFPDAVLSEVKDWLKNSDSARSICHGAMYDVIWDLEELPPIIPANKCGARLGKPSAVAVGTTAMETLLTYAAAHHHPDSLEGDIHGLRTYLRAEDDSLDAQEAAEDEVHDGNFMHLDGGTHHYFGHQDEDHPAQPPPDTVKIQLGRLNAGQHLLDAMMRRKRQLQWEMFATWWKYISDIDNKDKSRTPIYKVAVQQIQASLHLLQLAMDGLRGQMKPATDIISGAGAAPKAGTLREFVQQRDPTLLIAGVQAGWPRDFQKPLPVRLKKHFVVSDPPPSLDKNAFGLESKCVPDDLEEPIIALMQEFLLLRRMKVSDPTRGTQIPPLYHDPTYVGDNIPVEDNPFRDHWADQQPWFPLYIEWEGLYIDIPFEEWRLQQKQTSRGTLTEYTQYVVKVDLSKQQYRDRRVLSGRNLILPQPSFTLKAHIQRILQIIPPKELDELLPEPRRTEIESNIDRFAFLSAPLSGFTDHLLTLATGSHVKPLVRAPGKRPIALRDAVKVGAAIGLEPAHLELIDTESDPTPYGSNMSLVGHDEFSAFKPVIHGQFRFTRLNIIDKFGQAISALPLPAEGESRERRALFPCVADYYAPQSLSEDGEPNVIEPHPPGAVSPKDCEFIQLPPAINQPARLNAAFLSLDHERDTSKTSGLGDPFWRPSSDWESPLWGWVMVNYVDRSIQLFLPDGRFYREVRVTEGTNADDVQWQPFPRPKDQGEAKNPQLERLVRHLIDPKQEYLLEFIEMIDHALRDTAPPPAAYGAFPNALTGRPLALANLGISLELSEKPRANQSTVRDQQGHPGLDLLKRYKFPVKLGNASRRTDGLICYFDKYDETRTDPDPRGPGNDLDLKNIYTYSYDKEKRKAEKPQHLNPIPESDLPTLAVYWDDPEKYIKISNPRDIDATPYEVSRNQKLRPFGALIDPFLPLHAYTGILPTQTLRLPTWTWESALKKIVTFFHVGPILVPGDVPRFDIAQELSEQKWEQQKGKPGTQPTEGHEVQLPALAVADWSWLQPYAVEEKKTGPLAVQITDDRGANDEPKKSKKYMALGIRHTTPQVDGQLGPHTAIEGYLQMNTAMESKGK
ncbi:hypothetical protein ARAM_004725 [Aspergillus rambellii]|uniref:Uncharacterized protein n=1 Tax=Aspergillus rambellii TaxID=308745 RepID=A0A0F8WNB4_9EURO|nr:hypothetical protein ARAM_004725 [Aspergillus rambellii]